VHPLLASRARILLYLGLWLGVAALLVWVLVLTGPRPVSHAAAFAGPLALIYAFACLSALWVCRAQPMGKGEPWRKALVLSGSALQSAAVWTVLAAGWGALLHARGIGPGWEGRARDLGILFVSGVVLYAQSIVAHYLVLAFEASRAAERRLLESQVAAREAELKALRAQLHPHFLFNSLNSIAQLIHSDPATAEACVERLAEIFRYILRRGQKEFVPLADELQVTEAYLDLERARFGDRLVVEIAVAPTSLGRMIPTLSLQPLVENAIRHGLARKVGRGLLHIEAKVHDGCLVLSVADDGLGMTAPALDSVYERGLGLSNLRDRLARLYGPTHRPEITSAPGQGTCVRLRLPEVPEGLAA